MEDLKKKERKILRRMRTKKKRWYMKEQDKQKSINTCREDFVHDT